MQSILGYFAFCSFFSSLVLAEMGGTLTGISPQAGPLAGGNQITLTGTGFRDGLSIMVDGIPCTSSTLKSATQAICVVPKPRGGAGSRDVSLRNGAAGRMYIPPINLKAAYTYQAGPALTSISPSSGVLAGGNVLTLNGSGFLAGLTVTVGGSSCADPKVSPTAVTCTLPSGTAGTKAVAITNPDGQSVSKPDAYSYLVVCGQADNGCYDNSDAMKIGQAYLPDGTLIELTSAAGTFKVWKEKNGARILNSSGLATLGWQQKLSRSGTAFSGTFLTETQIIGRLAGRVCPPNVFLDYSNMVTSGRCLYYDLGTPSQLLSSGNGKEGEDKLLDWTNADTGRGSLSSYYEGNVKVCADIGMRLPVIYETSVVASYFSQGSAPWIEVGPVSWTAPTGEPSLTVTWAGPKGVPTGPEEWTWTASAYQVPPSASGEYRKYFRRWAKDRAGIEASFVGPSVIRCVVP